VILVLQHYLCLPVYVKAHLQLPSFCEHSNAPITDTELVLLQKLHSSCDLCCKDDRLMQPLCIKLVCQHCIVHTNKVSQTPCQQWCRLWKHVITIAQEPFTQVKLCQRISASMYVTCCNLWPSALQCCASCCHRTATGQVSFLGSACIMSTSLELNANAGVGLMERPG